MIGDYVYRVFLPVIFLITLIFTTNHLQLIILEIITESVSPHLKTPFSDHLHEKFHKMKIIYKFPKNWQKINRSSMILESPSFRHRRYINGVVFLLHNDFIDVDF